MAVTNWSSGAVLEDVAVGADFHAFGQIILVVVHRENDDLGLGALLLDLARRYEAADPGHPNVPSGQLPDEIAWRPQPS
jgi:hypothetical protein